MKIVILGHNGFIGSHIMEFFNLFHPEIEIIGLSRREVDLCNRDSTHALIPHLSPDTTIIMLSGIKKQYGDSMNLYQKNMRMAEHICEIIPNISIRQFVYFSSAEVYGEQNQINRISEESLINPPSFYGIAKYSSEILLAKTLHDNETPLTILRPPLVYGSGDTSIGYGPSYFLDCLMKDTEITLWGDGSELREFVYVKDISRLVWEIVMHGSSGIINPVSGISISYLSIIHTLSSIVGKEPKIIAQERTKEKVDMLYSNELIQKQFPDFSFTSIDLGLEDMIYDEKKRRG